MASLAVFFMDSRLNAFSSVRTALSTVTYSLQVIAALPSDMGDWSSEFFQTRDQLKQENTQLINSNRLSNIRLQKLQGLERENMRLRELLGSSFRLSERVLVAELLAVDLDPFLQQVVIDKGKNSGIFVGQSVLDATGVMGQVTAVDPFSSRVVLLTDPSHAIPIQINRNGLRAVVTGRGLGKDLSVQYLPYNADVRVGDVLITSGLGGRFPTGYPVGTIVSIDLPVGQAFAEISVEPAAHLSTSREVLLVLSNTKPDLIIEAQVNETESISLEAE